jgi:phosphomannomutase
MSKKKMDLNPSLSLASIFEKLEKEFAAYPINKVDGMKIDFEKEWVHLRSSNTEPIIRIYTEAPTQAAADHVADRIIAIIGTIQ